MKEPSLTDMVRRVPIFAALPRLELARLLPELQARTVPAGTEVGNDEEQAYVYFVCSGQVKVNIDVEGDKVAVVTLNSPAVFGALGFVTPLAARESVVALNETVLVYLPAASLAELFRRIPSFGSQFTEMVSQRLSMIQHELARTRRMLDAFAKELWEPAAGDLSAAEVCVSSQRYGAMDDVKAAPDSAGRRQPGPGLLARLLQRHQSAGISVAVAVVLWITLQLVPGLTHTTRISLTIMSWATVGWVLTKLPEYVVAVGAVLAYLLLGLVPVKEALSGYADPTWFMILGVFGIGAGIARSGLLYRAALNMLHLMPPTYSGQTLAMALTGLLVTPCLPSANARVALAGPLALEVGAGLGFSRQSDGMTGIGMACLLGFGHMYYLFLNGTSSCLLVWGLLPPAVRQQVTWGFWLLAALPLGVIGFLFSYLAIVKLLPVKGRRALVSRSMLQAQLEVINSVTRNETITLVIVCLVLVAFVTEPLHHIHPAWPAMIGFLVLAAVGIVDKETVKQGIDWNFLLLFGSLISLATITRSTGVNDALTTLVMPALSPLVGHPVIFLTALALLTVLLRVAIPWQPAVLIIVVTLMPLVQHTGYSPFVVGLIALAMSNPYYLPQQNTVYMTIHAGMNEAFTHKRVRTLAVAHTVILLVGVIASIPLWMALGLVPR